MRVEYNKDWIIGRYNYFHKVQQEILVDAKLPAYWNKLGEAVRNSGNLFFNRLIREKVINPKVNYPNLEDFSSEIIFANTIDEYWKYFAEDLNTASKFAYSLDKLKRNRTLNNEEKLALYTGHYVFFYEKIGKILSLDEVKGINRLLGGKKKTTVNVGDYFTMRSIRELTNQLSKKCGEEKYEELFNEPIQGLRNDLGHADFLINEKGISHGKNRRLVTLKTLKAIVTNWAIYYVNLRWSREYAIFTNRFEPTLNPHK